MRQFIAFAKVEARPRCSPEAWPQLPSSAAYSAPPPPSASSSPVTRLTHSDVTPIDPDHFRRVHEAARTPALLSGLLERWAALPRADRVGESSSRAWTIEQLSQRLGDQLVHVGETDDGEDVPIPLGVFCEDYLADGSQCDRNPMLVFDAVVMERLRREAESALCRAKRVGQSHIRADEDVSSVDLLQCSPCGDGECFFHYKIVLNTALI